MGTCKKIQLSADFLDHPKTLRLMEICGTEAMPCLLRLWSWVAEYFPSGSMPYVEATLEAVAQWPSSPGMFFDALVEVGFIVAAKSANIIKFHDWADHQPWIAGQKGRSEHARKAINARWAKRKYSEYKSGSRTGKHTPSIEKEDSNVCGNVYPEYESGARGGLDTPSIENDSEKVEKAYPENETSSRSGNHTPSIKKYSEYKNGARSGLDTPSIDSESSLSSPSSPSPPFSPLHSPLSPAPSLSPSLSHPNIVSPKKEILTSSAKTAAEADDDDSASRIQSKEIIAEWNRVAKIRHWRKSTGKKRIRDRIRAALRRKDFRKDWREALATIEKRGLPFVENSDPSKAWLPSLDWFLRPQTQEKIDEENYWLDEKPKHPKSGKKPMSAWLRSQLTFGEEEEDTNDTERCH